MTTRFDSKSSKNYGVEGVQSGYRDKSSSELTIPSCGLVDVDKAVFNLFDKEIQFSISNKDKTLKKVPVIFVAGEKWSIVKNGKPVRDKTNTLILPLITIVRNNVSQTDSDITGRGINQQTGELVIKTRLNNSDRPYQNLVNQFLLTNQENVVSNVQTATRSGDDRLFVRGKNEPHVYEYVVVPAPQFCTVSYEITIWTQYHQHMNQVLDTMFSSYLPQAQSWKVTTDSGYWFIAKNMDGGLTSDVNFDDISMTERIIKYQFNVDVQAYIFASQSPGVPIPVKRYVSSPSVSFVISDDSEQEGNQTYSLGVDDPTLPIKGSQREEGRGRLYERLDKVDEHDPALKNVRRGQSVTKYKKVQYRDVVTGKMKEKYVRIEQKRGSSGETLYSSNFSFEDIAVLFNDE